MKADISPLLLILVITEVRATFIYQSFLLQLTITNLIIPTISVNSTQTPCWCSSLNRKVKFSTKKLQDRYGRNNNLDTATFASSGKYNGLVQRLYNHLMNKTPFRIALVGGSYIIPDLFDSSTWIANFTRWVNVMLSSSTCDPKTEIKLSQNESNCAGFPTLEVCKNKTILSSTGHGFPVFCQPFDTVQNSYLLHPTNKPYFEICDDAHYIVARPCSVYIGSGKYATISNAAKGGRTTFYSESLINRILNPNEQLDYLFWDHSVNDVGNGNQNHQSFAMRFFEELFKYHKNIVGVGIVYWPDGWRDEHENRTACNTFINTMPNGLATLHYPYLKRYFDPYTGRYKNISVLTMSAAQFCRKNGCNKFDFIHQDTAHPHSIGNSRFADLVIWQFLHVFKNVVKKYCSSSSGSGSSSSSSSGSGNIESSTSTSTTESRKEKGDEVAWLVHRKGNANGSYNFDYQELLRQPMPETSRPLTFPGKFNIANITILGTLAMATPVIGNPLPVSEFAILCAPGIPAFVTNAHLKIVFHDEQINGKNTNKPLRWVPADITTIFNESCAGWINKDDRNPQRHDAEHAYQPSAIRGCHDDCPVASWAGSNYPHGYWNELPKVKVVDLVFRVSTSLEWTHFCFWGKCQPKLLWHTAQDQWAEAPDAIVREGIHDFIWSAFACHKRSNTMKNLKTDYVYFWYPADDCYPTRKDPMNWRTLVDEDVRLLHVQYYK